MSNRKAQACCRLWAVLPPARKKRLLNSSIPPKKRRFCAREGRLKASFFIKACFYKKIVFIICNGNEKQLSGGAYSASRRAAFTRARMCSSQASPRGYFLKVMG